MAKRKTTVPPDEQDLESVGTEVLPPAEDAAPAEEDMAAAPDPSSEIPVFPDEDSGLAGEGSPDGDAAQEDALLEESDLSRADSPPSGEEFPTAPEEQQAAEDETYGGILQELGGSAPDREEPLTLEQSDASQSETEGFSEDDLMLLSEEGASSAEDPAPPADRPVRPAPADPRRSRILTIDARDEIQTEAEREATIWHEIQNSYRTRRILTGSLDGVEKTESGLTLAVVNYKGFRVAIPVKEMMLYTGKMPSGREFMELMDRLHRILNSRLGAEIDFVVKGYDNDTRSVVASRRDAMLRKRQTFYMDTDELGEHLIYEGRVVQARVVAVAEKVIRVEVFGVECSIVARGLSWEWIGNAREHFSVGDRILVRVLRIQREDLEHITIQVDARSVSATTSHDNLKKCMPQCRYAGRVTDVRNGVVFIRLNNGVNAIAHSCYDLRAPGKSDDVSFAVTRLDEEQGVAVGIITRIIKQHL